MSPKPSRRPASRRSRGESVAENALSWTGCATIVNLESRAERYPWRTTALDPVRLFRSEGQALRRDRKTLHRTEDGEMRRNGRPWLSSTAALVLLLAAPIQTPAATEPAALPFTPPAGWQPLPAKMLPDLALSWVKGTESFGVTRINFPIDGGQLAQALKAGSQTIGTVVSSDSTAICNAPAAKVVIKIEDSKELLTEQMQSMDGATYVLVYRHPEAGQPEHAIDAFMGGFCGSRSLGATTPPAGWRSQDAKVLGVWFSPRGPSESITALSRTPQGDVESWVSFALNTTANSSAVAILSKKNGTLCGNPAFFFSATATPHGVPAVEIQVAATQATSASYMLLYSRPKTSVADPAAVASLSTLCISHGAQTIRPEAAPAAALPTPQ
jgi:hypothetical protein